MWKWWLAAATAVAAAALGGWGLWLYEHEHLDHADLWSVGYHTIQLFALHGPHLDHEIPWQLHAGRWLATALVLGAVATGFVAIFRSECRIFAARFRGRHVVVCGLSRIGSQLAREFRASGHRVVGIAADPHSPAIAALRGSGVAIVVGDPSDPHTLRRAGVAGAAKIIAASDDQQENVAVAARAGEIVGGRRAAGEPAECWLLVTDARLRHAFQQEGLFPHTDARFRVNVRGLDMFELAARQALRHAPLDFERVRPADATTIHLVIVGFSSMGTALALQAAKIGHFANGRKLRITVVERRESTRVDEFLRRCPAFERITDFTRVQVDVDENHVDPEVIARAIPQRGENELVSVAVGWKSPRRGGDPRPDFVADLERDDATNLSITLALIRQAGRRQILVFQTRRTGFGALFPAHDRGAAIGPLVHAFGFMEDTWSIQALLHERDDAIAMALHARFYDEQRAAGRAHGSRPSVVSWAELGEHLKESNRRAADHIFVKMRAIGYRVADLREDRPAVTEFQEDEVEMLARMEHDSWGAEWLLQGYSYAPGERDDKARTQPHLVPWEELESGVQDYDRKQVRAIPEALRAARYAIYPQVL